METDGEGPGSCRPSKSTPFSILLTAALSVIDLNSDPKLDVQPQQLVHVRLFV